MSNTNKAIIGMVKLALEKAPATESKAILSAMAVDTFIAITSYENNRDVEERATKQAKSDSAHMNSDQVAIAVLDPEINKALWERTEKLATERGEAHTLPFIKVDGHTRAYGWKTAKGEGHLFARPESLFITVHKGLTDDQIFALVKEYCDGVSKANNKELQQMGMKKVEFAPTTDFVKKDSWKTAFRTIDRKWGKDTDAAIEHFKEALQAIDALNIETKNTTKKLSGVRAAMLTSYMLAAGDKKATINKWRDFWTKFFSPKIKNADISALFEELAELGTGDSAKALEMCEDLFKSFSGMVPTVAELEEAAPVVEPENQAA